MTSDKSSKTAWRFDDENQKHAIPIVVGIVFPRRYGWFTAQVGLKQGTPQGFIFINAGVGIVYNNTLNGAKLNMAPLAATVISAPKRSQSAISGITTPDSW